MDVKTRIEQMKQALRKAEQAKTVTETQLQTAETQLQETVKQLESEGVTPETLQQEILKLENQLPVELGKLSAKFAELEGVV